MNLADLDLRNTQQLMDDIAARTPLDEDAALLVLVDRPSTTQRLLDVRRLQVPARQTTWSRELSDLLYDEMWALSIPPRDPQIRAVAVTVLVRRGFVGWGRAEKTWALAWRYSNHNTDALDHDIIVVTEHGWASLWSHAAGVLPATAPAA
jgi:hypothetical protein